MLVDRLGHLKHVQFLTAKDRLQLIVGQDFSFVLWILKFVLLNVGPNLFCDFTSSTARIKNSRSASRSPTLPAISAEPKPWPTKWKIWTSSAFWPWRSTRPLRCSIRLGFH